LACAHVARKSATRRHLHRHVSPFPPPSPSRSIKKRYFKLVLASHPDKGGDPAIFRDQNEAFESLRDLYDSGRVHAAGFTWYLGTAAGAAGEGRKGAPPPRERPARDYAWYEAAAGESVPPYRTEAAKSGRSSCKGTCHGDPKEPAACEAHLLDPLIPEGSLRCGSIDMETGTYGRWRHIACWRVPASVWLGLPNPDATRDAAAFEDAIVSMQGVTLSGFSTLPSPLKAQFVAFCMDKLNWAKLTKASAAKAAAAAAARAGGGGGGGASSSSHYAPPYVPGAGAAAAAAAAAAVAASAAAGAGASSQALAPVGAGARFIIPRPGVGGAVAGALGGKTFVLTGVFPEVGGGAGLDLGKARVRFVSSA